MVLPNYDIVNADKYDRFEMRINGVLVERFGNTEAMIAKLQAKPGGDEIEVVEGSFADFDLDQHYSLIYVVFNTFYGTQVRSEPQGLQRSDNQRHAQT